MFYGIISRSFIGSHLFAFRGFGSRMNKRIVFFVWDLFAGLPGKYARFYFVLFFAACLWYRGVQERDVNTHISMDNIMHIEPIIPSPLPPLFFLSSL